MKHKQQIGVFGGSFDPIHIGHLALANYICEYEKLDELWFMLTPQNPLKKKEAGASESQRMELIRLAIQEYPQFKASDFELQLNPPYYTAHTLKELRNAYPAKEFILIIGADNWNQFNHWRNPEKILANHQILIYPRPQHPVDESKLPESVKLMNSPLLEISSTMIRKAFSQGKELPYFLHPEVYRVIREKGIY